MERSFRLPPMIVAPVADISAKVLILRTGGLCEKERRNKGYKNRSKPASAS
jgi:hypothetical protein